MTEEFRYRYLIHALDQEYIVRMIESYYGVVPAVIQHAKKFQFKWNDDYHAAWLPGSCFSMRFTGEDLRVPDFPFYITAHNLFTKWGSFKFLDTSPIMSTNHISRLTRTAAAAGVMIWMGIEGIEWEGRKEGLLWEPFDPHVTPLTMNQYIEYMVSQGKCVIHSGNDEIPAFL